MTQLSSSEPSAARRMATYLSGLQWHDVPEQVAASAKMRVLDMLGIIVGAQGERGPSALRGIVEARGGRPEATLVGGGLRVPAPQAAWVNGTFGHAQDFDDTHHASRIHASTVVVPAALAAAEAAGASGVDLLRAVVAGLEAVVRTGMVAPGRFHERGLHATSLCGVMGAAVAAAVATGASAAQTMQALGIAGSMASGLREAYLGEPTDTKALHAGWAAQAGLEAAALAKAGFTGPSTVMEGRFGYYNAFVAPDAYDLGALDQALGDLWHTPDIVFKLYPCGSLIHASIDAAIAIHEAHRPDPERIREIVCIAPPGMVTTVLEPVAQKLAPVSGYQAKFSTQYAVLTALLDGTVTEASYAEERVHDPRRRRMLAEVRYETDPAMPWPHRYPGGVRVVMDDGAVHEVRIENSPGSPDRPATVQDIARKFHGNVAGRVPEAQAKAMVERVMSLEAETDLTALLSGFAAKG